MRFFEAIIKTRHHLYNSASDVVKSSKLFLRILCEPFGKILFPAGACYSVFKRIVFKLLYLILCKIYIIFLLTSINTGISYLSNTLVITGAILSIPLHITAISLYLRPLFLTSSIIYSAAVSAS